MKFLEKNLEDIIWDGCVNPEIAKELNKRGLNFLYDVHSYSYEFDGIHFNYESLNYSLINEGFE